jgi:pectinesterase
MTNLLRLPITKKNLIRSYKINSIYKPLLLAAIVGVGFASQANAQTAGRALWSMKRSNQDSVVLRSAGLTAVASLSRLVVSDGSTPASGTTTVPYSATRGQAFAPNADGSGWPSAAPSAGPGSNPRRSHYEQFAVTVTTPTRLDSLLFTTVATSSPGGRVAVMYSLSNFTADSSNFSGGKGPAYAGYTSGSTTVPASSGGVLPATADGSFPATGTVATTSAIVPQFVSATGNTGTFRFAMNGATGVVLPAGRTLTVRLYFTINNSAAGRYILLKDVTLKGQAGTATATKASRAQTNLVAYPNPVADRLLVQHPTAATGGRVTIYSLTGQPVATTLAQPGTVSTALSLSQLASGLYLAEYADSQQRITAKVVKQ